MIYKPLREILADLDAQQRNELAVLGACVGEGELQQRRAVKRQLSSDSAFFIERTWDAIAADIQAFSLEVECGKSRAEVREHLGRLRRRGPSYSWAWLRARMNSRLMKLLEDAVPPVLSLHPERAAHYIKSLSLSDFYWFRETPIRHLKAGYHTALGVACKWYGSAFELLEHSPDEARQAARRFPDELRLYATFSMTMLARTDGFLWDSAGALPFDVVWDGENLMAAQREVEDIALQTAPDYGLRLGCPALRARSADAVPPLTGIIDWVEQVFAGYLLSAEP